ncbi:MAG: antibiotic biosynthesis monooxygenase [Actinobacteria bacterium]|nr:antibiotic biosynthesis monooxygenase [Actinomycetota bacterium]
MVLVQFRVTVPDVDRFKAAFEKWRDTFEGDGAGNQQLWHSESNPNEITMMAEWESHDAMMESSEERGDAFQDDAGTEGLEWETHIWHRLA